MQYSLAAQLNTGTVLLFRNTEEIGQINNPIKQENERYFEPTKHREQRTFPN